MMKAAPDLSTISLAAGEPLLLETQFKAADGTVPDMTGRSYVLSFYRDDRSTVKSITGDMLSDDDGHFFRFARDGTLSEGLIGQRLTVELAERLRNGRYVITSGALTIGASALGVTSLDTAVVGRVMTRITIRDAAALGDEPVFALSKLPYDPVGGSPAPRWSILPSLTDDGTPQVGEAIVGNDGTITNGVATGRRFMLNGAPISGATGASYTPIASDAGKALTLEVTATGLGGTHSEVSASILIAAATVVTPPPELAALALSAPLVSGVASNGTIAGLTTGSALTTTLAGLTVNRADASYAFNGVAAGGATGDLIETLAGATRSPRPTSLTVQAGTLTISPRAPDYVDSFVGDGALNTRPGWSVPAGEESRWGTTAGQLFYKEMYGPLSRAVFGGDLGDQEVEIEYDTTTKGDPWTDEHTFFNLAYKNGNFLRARFAKGVPTVRLNPVIDGAEGPSITFNRPTPAADKGKLRFKLVGGVLRVAWDGVWAKTIDNRFAYPYDRAILSEYGAGSLTGGKVAVEARTFTFSRADAISTSASQIAILVDDEFVGRDSTTATGGTWTATGTYAGTPVQWAARVLDFRTGSVVVDWATPKAVTAANGEFSVNVFLPTGGPYTTEVAWIGADGFARVAQSRPALSGYHIVYYGQSNSVYRARPVDGTVRGDRYCSFVSRLAQGDSQFPAGHWASTLTDFRASPASGAARAAAPLLNVPVAVTAGGVDATPISYLSPGQGGWTTFLEQISTLKGIIEIVIWDQGEGDADGAEANSEYVATFRDVLLPALRERARNLTMKVLIARVGNFPAPSPLGAGSQARFDAQRETIRQAHRTLVDTVPGVSFASFKLGADHAGDPYHYTDAAYDTVLGTRDGLSVAKALGASTYDGRGPQVTGATRNGATITLAIDRNGADTVAGPVAYNTYSGARVAAPANSFKGYEVSADGFATNLPISDISVSNGNLVITLASAPAGAVKVRSFAGGSYDDTSLFVGQYAGGLTIPVAPIIKYLTA